MLTTFFFMTNLSILSAPQMTPYSLPPCYLEGHQLLSRVLSITNRYLTKLIDLKWVSLRSDKQNTFFGFE